MALNTSDYEQAKYRKQNIPGLKRHKKEQHKFLIDTRKHGKRIRVVFTVDTDTPENMVVQAQLKMNDKINAKLKDTLSTSSVNPNITVEDFFEEYYKEDKKWSKKHSQIVDGLFKRRIKPLIGDKKLKRVIPIDISNILKSAYKIDRKGEYVLDEDKNRIPSSTRVKKSIMEIIQPLFQKAVRLKLINETPVTEDHQITRVSLEEKRVVVNAADKYRAVHKAIHKCFADNHKVRALMLLGFYGRRRSEVLNMKWEHIAGDEYKIPPSSSKVNVEMSFTLPLDVKEALSMLEQESDYVFNSNRYPNKPLANVYDYSQAIIKETGIKEFNFHYMRNLAVSALSEMGVEAVHLSAILGHTDTSTVKQYLSLQRKESSKKAIEQSMRLLHG